MWLLFELEPEQGPYLTENEMALHKAHHEDISCSEPLYRAHLTAANRSKMMSKLGDKGGAYRNRKARHCLALW